MRYLHLTIFLFIGFMVASCDSSDILSLPKQDSKLVVNCVGYDAYTWKARISASRDVLDLESYAPVNNAEVKLYENDLFAETLVFDTLRSSSASGSLYRSLVSKTSPGNLYRITVESVGYPTVESEFRQPTAVTLETFSLKLLGPNSSEPDFTDVQFTVGFNDPPGENYYEIYAIADSGETPFAFSSHVFTLSFVDPAYRENNGLFFQSLAFDDTYFDGESVEFDFISQVLSLDDVDRLKHYTIFLRNLSKEYYVYLKTTNIQFNTANDPFAQPVLISNNITNGYGVFGGFTETFKTTTIDN